MIQEEKKCEKEHVPNETEKICGSEDCWHKGPLVQGGVQLWQGPATSERSDIGSGVRHKKGESCQMASASCPSRMLHICLGEPPVPQSCGYMDTWVCGGGGISLLTW